MKSYRIYYLAAKYRLWITKAIALACIAEFLIQGIPRFINQSHSPTSYLIGSALILSGNFMRSWAAGVIHKRKVVTNTGPYSLCRNPLYIGSGLVALGFGFFLKDPWYWYSLMFIAIFIYPVTIRNEEITMKSRHPEEWDEYTDHVGAFYPKKLRKENIQANWSVKLWVANREYSMFAVSTVTWLTILSLIVIHS